MQSANPSSKPAKDIEAVRASAKALGKQPFIIAKIERSRCAHPF
jgi:hypothetical protein